MKSVRGDDELERRYYFQYFVDINSKKRQLLLAADNESFWKKMSSKEDPSWSDWSAHQGKFNFQHVMQTFEKNLATSIRNSNAHFKVQRKINVSPEAMAKIIRDAIHTHLFKHDVVFEKSGKMNRSKSAKKHRSRRNMYMMKEIIANEYPFIQNSFKDLGPLMVKTIEIEFIFAFKRFVKASKITNLKIEPSDNIGSVKVSTLVYYVRKLHGRIAKEVRKTVQEFLKNQSGSYRNKKLRKSMRKSNDKYDDFSDLFSENKKEQPIDSDFSDDEEMVFPRKKKKSKEPNFFTDDEEMVSPTKKKKKFKEQQIDNDSETDSDPELSISDEENPEEEPSCHRIKKDFVKNHKSILEGMTKSDRKKEKDVYVFPPQMYGTVEIEKYKVKTNVDNIKEKIVTARLLNIIGKGKKYNANIHSKKKICKRFDDLVECRATCYTKIIDGNVHAEIQFMYMTPQKNEFEKVKCVPILSRVLCALLAAYKERFDEEIRHGYVLIQTMKETACKGLNCYRKAFMLNGFKDLDMEQQKDFARKMNKNNTYTSFGKNVSKEEVEKLSKLVIETKLFFKKEKDY